MPGHNAHALNAHAAAMIAMSDSHGARRTAAVCGHRVPSVDLFCVVVDIRAFPKLCGNPPNPTGSRITL
ncbi:hypothetical protein, partial [Burkholderia anthina]|uniref:hypothetical protein n=1 Tax=Burkholderia anthina TaxID=179879 RepID=UPI001FC82FCD